MGDNTQVISLPPELIPADGRFGCGPSKVRQEALQALAATGASLLGTSHRKPAVKEIVGRVRAGLTDLYQLPEGYEVLLGNGGATAFWDAMVFGLIEAKSQHLVFGEFSSKFAKAARAAPHLNSPQVVGSDFGHHPPLIAGDGVDLYAQTHNETSTGVIAPIGRPAGAAPEALVAVDATSAAGGVETSLEGVDVYYFSAQKAFAAEGGLWVAICSPAAVARVEKIKSSGRYIPTSLDLATALENSRKDQTYNTPALSSLFFLADTLGWINSQGGLAWAAGRCKQSAEILYGWAEASDYATPFVGDPAARSPLTATIDLDEGVSAAEVSKILRQNGILDTEAYRKLGRNQLRIGLFPAIEPDDVRTLTQAIDHVVAALRSRP